MKEVHGFCNWQIKSGSVMIQNLTQHMQIHNLTQPALLDSIDSYTKKIIHFVLRGHRGKDYFNSKETLESLLTEWNKRRSAIKYHIETKPLMGKRDSNQPV